MLSSHSIVSSFRTVRPCSPWGGRWIGHWRTTWSMVCSSALHSQGAEEAIPYLYKQERKRPTAVRRRLSRTQALLGRVTRGLGCRCRGWKYGVLWNCLPTPHFIGDPPTAPHICCCCQMNWWDVVRRVQMGVSIWGAVGLHSMDGWVLSGADVQAPQHGVLETVWLRCDEAQQVIWLPGRLSAGVARKHPVTIRKASLMAGSMRRVWALWHQRGAQYSAVEWTRTRWLFAQLLLQHPNRSQQAASGALHVMSTSCEVTQGVGDTSATCPTLPRGIWARCRRAGFRCWSWLSAHT